MVIGYMQMQCDEKRFIKTKIIFGKTTNHFLEIYKGNDYG